MNSTLNKFLNIYWLRPETAVLLSLRSLALSQYSISEPAVDVSCGDGIFPFVHYGGELNKEFDVYSGSKGFDTIRKEKTDVYDSIDGEYSPVVIEKSNFKYELGLDWKQNSLMRAEMLDGLYDKTDLVDVTHNINLPDDSYQSITNFASINHYSSIEPFLSECYRILNPGGSFVIVIQAPGLVDMYYKLEATYPKEWLSIIERDMRNIWPIMFAWNEWKEIFEKKGFVVNDIKAVGNNNLSRIWNVGLRPLLPELARMADIVKKYDDNEFMDIKHNWVDLFSKLTTPFCHNTDDLNHASELIFVLSK